jgi:hypothetical protein
MCRHHSSPPPAVAPNPAAAPAGTAAAPQQQPAGFQATAAPRRAPGTRRKLWQLPAKFHCPLIGTCLHVDELRAVARRTAAVPERGVGDYQMHVSFVAAADHRNPLSAATQKALDRKYAAALRRFARARSTAALRTLWEQHLAEGRVPEAFWALMTHPQADPPLHALAYEEIHMRSHQIGAGLAADVQALTETRAELRRLRREQAAASARHAQTLAERDRRLAALTAQTQALRQSEQDLHAARARIHDLEAGNALRELWERLGSTEAQRDAEATARRSAEADNARLRDALTRARAEARTLAGQLAEREAVCAALEQLLGTGPACTGDCDDCARAHEPLDLGGRRILCVGGRGSLARHYRELVQRCNGELVRHDGGLEESRQRLESLLASADAVVCPADAVSHDAYLRAKRFCKRTAKPYVLLERSGIGAFARALADLAAAANPPATAGAAAGRC